MMPPERIYVLKSDAEDLSELQEGRLDSVLAGISPCQTMHGEVATVQYIRRDAFPVEELDSLFDSAFFDDATGIVLGRILALLEQEQKG